MPEMKDDLTADQPDPDVTDREEEIDLDLDELANTMIDHERRLDALEQRGTKPTTRPVIDFNPPVDVTDLRHDLELAMRGVANLSCRVRLLENALDEYAAAEGTKD
jgi:hypothetical protein